MKDKITVILAAGGSGERAKQNKNKILTEIDGKACIKRTFDAFYATGVIEEYVVAAKPEDAEEIKSLLPDFVKTVSGGITRTESVKNALKATTGEIVLIHDAARPFVTERIIKDCIESAIKYGSGVAAIPSRDTVVKYDGKTTGYLGKSGLYLIQTPQCFKTADIKAAYEKAGDTAFNDDGEVYLNSFGDLKLVAGDKNNIKLTYPEDFCVVKTETRFGTGFDCHRLVENRKLILGGVEISHDKGLLGHSDADVLTHAIMDAILSACSMRDIGYWFPDNDEKYEGANSLKLLAEVLRMISEKGFKVTSVSAVIMAEKPKLLKHIPAITESLASALNIASDNVGISATTLEGLGFVGREEGICVHANAVVIK
ncbi:MAG: 2-C-methyl-D-erythritol 2,4-cyclodiphosphate synthase [Clostridia bacterium]|nr:2-C-methyl-D-erythritol 2,4-cyclodiphosphate synthase [Clostridia bacterium]